MSGPEAFRIVLLAFAWLTFAVAQGGLLRRALRAARQRRSRSARIDVVLLATSAAFTVALLVLCTRAILAIRS